jgi:DNA polymerase III subunit gamma/tau
MGILDTMADSRDTPSEDQQWQSLYRRYRPQRFSEIRGQDHVTLALRNAVREAKVAHAYLFSGPRGTGKTSTARILAKALNCTALSGGEPCGTCDSCTSITRGASFDVHELDAASNNGVDAMRDLVARASLATPGRWKVYIVDEVHMLSTAASNALLKTLEEPPSHVVFVLATTDPQKVLPTIRSRTQHFEFHLLSNETLTALLAEVAKDASLSLPEDGVEVAVRRGRGSARDALSVLDQVVAAGIVDDDAPVVAELVAAIAQRDTGRALAAVAQGLEEGRDVHRLAVDVVEQLRRGFLVLAAPKLAAQLEASLGAPDASVEQIRELGIARCVRAMELIGATQVDMRSAADPRITLEMALARLTHPEADDSPAALLERIERLERQERQQQEPASGRAGEPAFLRPPPVAPAISARPMATIPAPATPTTAAATPGAEAPPGGSVTTPGDGATPASGMERPALGAFRSASPASAPPAAAPAVAAAGHTAGPAAAGPVAVAEAEPREPRELSEPSEPSEPPAGVPEPADGPTRDELVEAWGDYVLTSLRPKARTIYQAGRFTGAGGGVAVFALPNEFHLAHAEPHRDEVSAALSRHFKRPVELQLVVEPDVSTSAGGEGRPGRASHAAAAEEDLPDPEEFAEAGGVSVEDTGVSWATDRLLEAFPGAEEV